MGITMKQFLSGICMLLCIGCCSAPDDTVWIELEFKGFCRGSILMGEEPGYKHTLRTPDGDEYLVTESVFNQSWKKEKYKCLVSPYKGNGPYKGVIWQIKE